VEPAAPNRMEIAGERKSGPSANRVASGSPLTSINQQ